MNEQERDNMIQETHETVTELRSAVIGVNGKGGLIDKVEEVCVDHAKLKNKVTLLIGILAGSGALTGTTVGLINLISG